MTDDDQRTDEVGAAYPDVDTLCLTCGRTAVHSRPSATLTTRDRAEHGAAVRTVVIDCPRCRTAGPHLVTERGECAQSATLSLPLRRTLDKLTALGALVDFATPEQSDFTEPSAVLYLYLADASYSVVFCWHNADDTERLALAGAVLDRVLAPEHAHAWRLCLDDADGPHACYVFTRAA